MCWIFYILGVICFALVFVVLHATDSPLCLLFAVPGILFVAIAEADMANQPATPDRRAERE